MYLGRAGARGSLSLRERQSGAHGVPCDRYAIGIHHIAFTAASRKVVDERASWVGGLDDATIESPPREYDYTPGYYALFLHDPDGIKLEILHRP